MARIVDGRPTRQVRRLTSAERRQAEQVLARLARRNPLRRVRLECHGPFRDPVAVVGDLVWCEVCADTRRVTVVVE